ncbi:phosphomannose isomerase type II C-terminal cupin domain [Candidatus Uabimicrobium sp. HlEnr_7]|uniref:phosphomannose isomerase type II C-terminal cupin domain n=1 Tax=Candidatus Uabimicrobium helgolandensis TaxID=3095367 RepID=UPI003557CBE0
MSMETDTRPWGYYTVLNDEKDHKVKKIVVSPQGRLSLQRHQKRSEHWYVIQGEAIITLNENKITKLPGEYVDIPCGTIHRVENRGDKDLVFIEIQTGSYFGEDDIERLEDDYGRK